MPSGRYRWTDLSPVAETPEWLLPILEPEMLPELPAPAPWVGRADSAERYARRVLDTACDTCATAGTARHDTWFKQAVLVGGYVGGGHLGEEMARAELIAAATRSLRPGEHRGREVRKTVADGIALGMSRPCHPPPRT
jgi:hypothetical protein